MNIDYIKAKVAVPFLENLIGVINDGYGKTKKDELWNDIFSNALNDPNLGGKNNLCNIFLDKESLIKLEDWIRSKYANGAIVMHPKGDNVIYPENCRLKVTIYGIEYYLINDNNNSELINRSNEVESVNYRIEPF